MHTKLEVARIATGYGAYMAIARSRDEDVINRLLKGEDLGTLFLPQRPRMESRKRWIAFAGRDPGPFRWTTGRRGRWSARDGACYRRGLWRWKGNSRWAT